jgi:putative DNA-invertase from lambdoid prophage Rac
MATFGYVRVSAVRQAEESECLDVQQCTIAGYSMMHGLLVDQTFAEAGVSGSVPLRNPPQGKMLSLHAGVKKVLAAAEFTMLRSRTQG